MTMARRAGSLRHGFQNYKRLICARNDGFGNRDQLSLLIEDPES